MTPEPLIDRAFWGRIRERLAVDQAKAKLRAMTGADDAQIEQMTAQAQRLADSMGGRLSVVLEVMADQIAYAPSMIDVDARYGAARERLRSIVRNAGLNTDDDASVMLLYPMTVVDYERGGQPLLGAITDGDLVALAEHECGDHRTPPARR